jgi:hypothetical protein
MSGQGPGSWLPSVNDPIRAQQKGWRDRQTERLRSLEIEPSSIGRRRVVTTVAPLRVCMQWFGGAPLTLLPLWFI